MDVYEKAGTFKVSCDKELFGTEEIELEYVLHQQREENLTEHLLFIQTHFSKMYHIILKGILTAYNKSPKWDVWSDETQTFSRIEFHSCKEIHKYLGMPTIQVINHKSKILFGFSFFQNNRLSMEHGLTAILEGCSLLFIDTDDFCNILRNLDFPDSNRYKEYLYHLVR